MSEYIRKLATAGVVLGFIALIPVASTPEQLLEYMGEVDSSSKLLSEQVELTPSEYSTVNFPNLRALIVEDGEPTGLKRPAFCSGPILALDQAYTLVPNRIRVPQDFPTIQEAVAYAQAGSVIEVDGTLGPYKGPIIIDKYITLKSVNGRATIENPNRSADVIRVVSDAVQVKEFSLVGGATGIRLVSVQSVVLDDNVAQHNNTGILLIRSVGNMLTRNISRENSSAGILLQNSGNNALIENTVEENAGGIVLLEYSDRNKIEENTIGRNNKTEENKVGIGVNNSHGNRLKGNVIEGNEAMGIFVDGAHHNELQDNQVRRSGLGIALRDARNNTLTANICESNAMSGIYLANSSGNSLYSNRATDSEAGIFLDGSYRNMLKSNLIERTQEVGIQLEQSNINTLDSNCVKGSTAGVVLTGSHVNILSNNSIEDSQEEGIKLGNSSGNTLTANNVQGSDTAIMLSYSDENTVQESKIVNYRSSGTLLLDSVKNIVQRMNITLDEVSNTVGIGLINSDNNVVRKNATSGNRFGISILDSSENTLEGNAVSDNSSAGMQLEKSSDGNHVIANTLLRNRWGIALVNSGENHLTQNVARDNEEEGIRLHLSSDGNTLEDNKASGSNYGILVSNSDNNVLRGNKALGNNLGILLDEARDNLLEDNFTSGNTNAGIELQRSSDGNVLNNNRAEHNESGIILTTQSSRNSLRNNLLADNSLEGVFVTCDKDKKENICDTKENILENNTADSNGGPGFYLLRSSNNSLLGNKAHNNRDSGILIEDSDNNMLANNIVDINMRGIYLDGSHQNTLSGNQIDHNVYGLLLEGSNENSIGLRNDGNIIKDGKFGIDIRGGGGNTFKANTVEGNVYGVILDNFDINYFCFPPFYELVSGYKIRCMPTDLSNNTVRDNREADIQIPGLVAGEFLVQFGKEVSTEEAEQIIRGTGSEVVDYFQHLDIYHLRLPPEVQTRANQAEVFRQAQLQVNQFNGLAEVAFAELDVNLGLAEEQYPDDPRFDQQWNLLNQGQRHYTREGEAKRGKKGADIGILDAWNSGITDSSDVYVAIIDTGSTIDHPDLKGNLEFRLSHDFVNRDEMPLDHHGHGTFIAGIIGAIGNNGEGIAGISWKASIIALQVGDVFVTGGIRDDTRSGMSSILAAVEHVLDLKERGYDVRVVNFSLGYRKPLESLQVAMDRLEEVGILVVTAAGNNGDGTKEAGWDNDAVNQAIYPCNFENENIICVGASTDEDELAEFSNYGVKSVDLVAPGEDIVSLVPPEEVIIRAEAPDIPLLAKHPEARLDEYTGVGSGTSFAAPHVTGVAALLFVVCPEKSAVEIKDIILNNVERIDSLEGKVKTGGRLKWPDELPAGCRAPGEE